jgi:hypothetical protein
MGSVLNDRLLRIAYRVSRIANRLSQIAYRVSRIANRLSQIAYRVSRIGRTAAPIILHVFTFQVSIPQSGFGAFEPVRWRNRDPGPVILFQSLSRDSGRLNVVTGLPVGDYDDRVSIPQSGFGAFEPRLSGAVRHRPGWFQSLSRDSGRLNDRYLHLPGFPAAGVSIPQSGFGAFERPVPAPARISGSGGFNPSVGIRGV